jgi:protein Mpv17
LQKRINLRNHNVTLAARVFADQTAFAMTNLGFFLTSMAVMEGVSPKEKLQKSYVAGLKANWMLWPAIQAINFKLVPLHHRVFVVNVVSLGMNSLCYDACSPTNIFRVELLSKLSK